MYNHTTEVRQGRRCKTVQSVKLRRLRVEVLTLTLKAVLHCRFESAVSMNKREAKADVHIVRNVFNGHYLSIIQVGEGAEMWNGDRGTLF